MTAEVMGADCPPRDVPPPSACSTPIAVDLDGTLSRADTLHEGMFGALRSDLRKLLHWPLALREGKAAFKREVATQAPIHPELLPFNEPLVAFIRKEKSAGRRIGLFTAADQSIADRVAAHLGLFNVVRGSDGRTNLSGEAKIVAIREAFGERFTYAGDSAVDQPIFAAAESVLLVGRVDRLQAALPTGKTVEATFPQPRPGLRVWAKALRVQHWVKNALVFVAPVLGFQIASSRGLIEAPLLFLLFGMLASATYLLNDLFDLEADRRHPKKRLRPLAAGAISVRQSVVMAALLLGSVAVAALVLPVGAALSLLAYLGLTLAYSLVLKRIAMIDVVALSSLFTLRVWAGGTLLPAAVSPWLLTFSMLFFLGLAMIKRYAELERVLGKDPESGRARGYTARDLPILLATGVASGLSAIVIFMIYLINEQYPRQIYGHPGALWGIMPVLLVWTLRAWHMSVHGRMNEDPVVFALQDRLSLMLGLVVGLILLAAWI